MGNFNMHYNKINFNYNKKINKSLTAELNIPHAICQVTSFNLFEAFNIINSYKTK